MSDLQEPIDRLAIRELIDRYSVSVSKRDWAAVGDCFCADASWVTSVGHDFRGVDAIREGIRGAVEPFAFLIQMNHGTTIDALTADSARASTVVHEMAAPGSVFLLGLYEDRLVKQGGRWRFAARFFQAHYMDGAPLTGAVLVDHSRPA